MAQRKALTYWRMTFTGNICIASREILKFLITNRTNSNLLWQPRTYYLILKMPTTGSYLEPVLTRHSFHKIHHDILLSQETGISPLNDQKSLSINSASYCTLFLSNSLRPSFTDLLSSRKKCSQYRSLHCTAYML